MIKFQRMLVASILVILLISCAPSANIVRNPEVVDFSGDNEYTGPPVYDRNAKEPSPIDLRSSDLTKLDLSNSNADLLYANFDSKTQWPPADQMPYGFDWQNIMELNKNPGLGMRILHEQGITGKGIGLAIVDQPLLVNHREYAGQLQLYEEINISLDTAATMHGAAVASIAVGRTVGVAPGADLYYIGAWTGDWGPKPNDFTWNFTYYAQAVHRILEINKNLPEDRKIRVIAMQVGWHPSQKGYDEITNAVNTAKAEGVFVVSSSLQDTHGLNFHGLGRSPLSDPNDFWSYQPGLWWQDSFFSKKETLKVPTLLVPMDSRSTASPTGTEDYVFYREGGWSWSIPYIAGMYALSVQVKPDITPEEFWETALQTGRTIQIGHNGKEYDFGVILDPQALIAAIKDK